MSSMLYHRRGNSNSPFIGDVALVTSAVSLKGYKTGKLKKPANEHRSETVIITVINEVMKILKHGYSSWIGTIRRKTIYFPE